ncbi:hypothetical protein JTB14_038313 [Gonioctena quinquepunctata]|nr:hypothetical protein JTB14_038313 [Gonioctena quinquepunctata]
MLNALVHAKTPPSKMKQKKPSKTPNSTPIARRLRKRKVEQDELLTTKLDKFLLKKGDLKKNESKKNKAVEIENYDKSTKPNSKSKKRVNARNKTSPGKQQTLDSYFDKVPSAKRKTTKHKGKSIKRTDSSDSCDLPTFKSLKKTKKTRTEDEASLIKYGVLLPTVDEIIQDQKDLEKYKNQVESFRPLYDTSFELSFSTKNQNRTPNVSQTILDCKMLSLSQVTDHFRANVEFLSDIFHNKVPNERHARYYDKNTKAITLTTRDLSYNTSMIVFTFEQKEHMVNLLKEEFDPNDNMTHYFFQVLLPELCLKIFMDTHEMSYEDALIYLDERPVVGV